MPVLKYLKFNISSKVTFPGRILLLCIASFLTVFISAQNPAYTLELRNDIQVSSSVYEFDIYLLRTGTTTFEYAQGQYGMVINSMIKNGGTLSASIVPDSSDPLLVSTNQNPTSISYNNTTNAIMIAPKSPPTAGSGTIITNVSPGIRLCRVRITNTVDFDKYRPNLTWTTNLIYPTQVFAYVGGSNTQVTNYLYHSTSSLVNPILNEVTSLCDLDIDESTIQVYPNPFSEKLVIDYSLKNKSQVNLSVFDAKGKLVEVLASSEQQAGSYTGIWNSESHPEGVYIVKLQADMTKKLFRVVHIH